MRSFARRSQSINLLIRSPIPGGYILRPGLSFILISLFVWTGATTPFAAENETGIPVTNALILDECGVCHEADDEGRMQRISYLRKTPEGWQITLKRMIRMET